MDKLLATQIVVDVDVDKTLPDAQVDKIIDIAKSIDIPSLIRQKLQDAGIDPNCINIESNGSTGKLDIAAPSSEKPVVATSWDAKNDVLTIVAGMFPQGVHLEVKPTDEGVILDLYDENAEDVTWSWAKMFPDMLNDAQIERSDAGE